jgi:EF-hand domain pair
MKRLRPLSHTLALLAATNMSLAPALAPVAFADMQTTATDTTTTTTETATTTEVAAATTTTTVTTDNLATIIASLTSTDIATLQARYNELLDLITAKKYEITLLTDADDISVATAELTNMQNLATAFKAIIEGYEDSGAKTVTKTETYIDEDSGDTVTRTTYSDGSYTETVETDTDSDSDSDSSDSSSSSGSSFLEQMLQNPVVQGLITGLLQKLLSGGLTSLSSLLGGTAATNGDTLLGKVCDKKAGKKCETSDYSTPSPGSTAKTSSSSSTSTNTTTSKSSNGNAETHKRFFYTPKHQLVFWHIYCIFKALNPPMQPKGRNLMSSISSYANSTLSKALQELQQKFKTSDTSANGTLSQTELTTAAQGVDNSLTSADIATAFKQMDADGNGELTETELSDGIELADQVQQALLVNQEITSGSMFLSILNGGSDSNSTSSLLGDTTTSSDTSSTDSYLASLMETITAQYQATEDAATAAETETTTQTTSV